MAFSHRVGGLAGSEVGGLASGVLFAAVVDDCCAERYFWTSFVASASTFLSNDLNPMVMCSCVGRLLPVWLLLWEHGTHGTSSN